MYKLHQRYKYIKGFKGVSRATIESTLEEFNLELPEDRYINEFLSIETMENKEFLLSVLDKELSLTVVYSDTDLKRILEHYEDTLDLLTKDTTIPYIRPVKVCGRDELDVEKCFYQDILELDVTTAIAIVKNANLATAITIYGMLPNSSLPRFNLKPSYNIPNLKLGTILSAYLSNISKYISYRHTLENLVEQGIPTIKLEGELAIFTSLITHNLTPLFISLFKEMDNIEIHLEKTAYDYIYQ